MPWIDVANRADLDGQEVIGLQHDGLSIALYRLEGEYFATDNICTHQFAFLSEGCVVDGCIECPLHQGMFDIRTGKAQGGLVKVDIKTYPIRIEGGRIHVMVGEV
jgi:3-phenylpropionate/trans-cinnamate dioxygenase ferredoxin subunit